MVLNIYIELTKNTGTLSLNNYKNRENTACQKRPYENICFYDSPFIWHFLTFISSKIQKILLQ